MVAPTRVNLAITINGVNVTSYVDLNQAQPQITNALDAELDTLTLTLQEADAAEPVEWQEIIVTDGGVKIFGGFVLGVNKHASANATKNDYELGCSDYGAFLDKVYLKAEYEAQTDKQIIAAAFASSSELAGYDAVTYVKSLITFPRVRFNRKTVREILDWLCVQTGGHWYVDYDKKIHYFGIEEMNASYNVTDNPAEVSATKYTVENVKANKNGSGVVNLVEVVGGSKFSDDLTDYYTASSNTPNVYLNQRYKPPSTLTKIQVKRNDGGATTNLIVNPSFEVNITDGITQFQDGSGGAWVREANTGAFGGFVLKITAGTALVGIRYANVTLNPAESITASVTGWCNEFAKAGIRIYDVTSSAVLASAYNQKKTAWERMTCTYTNTGAVAMTVRLELINVGNDSARATYFDGAQLEKLAYPTGYCDGTLGTGYAWTGTAHNSTSTRVDMAIWTTLAVKAGGSDVLTSRNEVLYYESTARLEQQAFWPTSKNSIEIFGRYDIPMRTRVRNQASRDHYGKWMQKVVNALEIVDKSVGQMRGKAELAANAYGNTAVSYSTREPGLRAGQMQSVKNTARGINGEYLIQRVTTTIGVAGYVTVQVEMGAVDQSLVGLLLQLKRASTPDIEWNDNEVLDELLDISEPIMLEETIGAVAVTSGSYYMSDVPAEAFDWGFGAFEP